MDVRLGSTAAQFVGVESSFAMLKGSEVRLRYLSDLSSNGLADPMAARAVIQVRINRLVLLRGGAGGLVGGLMVLAVVGVEW